MSARNANWGVVDPDSPVKNVSGLRVRSWCVCRGMDHPSWARRKPTLGLALRTKCSPTCSCIHHCGNDSRYDLKRLALTGGVTILQRPDYKGRASKMATADGKNTN